MISTGIVPFDVEMQPICGKLEESELENSHFTPTHLLFSDLLLSVKAKSNHKPEKKAWEETSLANTLISDLSLQNCRK